MSRDTIYYTTSGNVEIKTGGNKRIEVRPVKNGIAMLIINGEIITLDEFEADAIARVLLPRRHECPD